MDGKEMKSRPLFPFQFLKLGMNKARKLVVKQPVRL